MLHKKCLVLGASRGLGASLVKQLPQAFSLSRSEGTDYTLDLCKPDAYSKVLELIKDKGIEMVFYVAGGGPHGSFLEKPWHSHEWAFQLNLHTPLQILQKLEADVSFVYVGSAIAERSQSPNSLSYSWSKKLAKEVILNSEQKKSSVFSPPYMDTDLLPKKAWPRLECPEIVLSADLVAEELITWVSKRASDDRCFDWCERFTYDLPNDRRGEL